MSLTHTNNRIDDPAADDHLDETGSRTAEEPPVADVEHAEQESKPGRRVSLSLRTLIAAVVVCASVATAGVLGWLYLYARAELAAQSAQAADSQRAEQVAIDYAVNAAEMDYQDFGTWKGKLVDGTSPELKDKLTKAAGSMEQVLAPLQWKSEARPLAAAVRSDSGGIYTVDAFVSVLTKTMQAPDGLQSTATYSITIDSRNNWQITDVGGIDAALGRK